MLFLISSPYPLYLSLQRKLLSSIFSGVFVALFLIIFQPFGTAAHDFEYKYWFLAGYGVITALVPLGLAFFLKTYFLEKNWTFGRQILWLLLELLVSTIFCYWYFISFFQYSFNWHNFALFIGYVLSIGVLPVTMITLVDYIHKLKQNQQVTTDINQHIIAQGNRLEEKKKPKEVLLRLMEENQKDELVINLEELLFIKASSNYVELYLRKKTQIEKVLFRGNLKYVESQIENPDIIRCHRSYLVHLKKVVETSGNAQGYRLHFDKFSNNDTPVIPVARSKGKFVMEKFK